MGNWILRLFGPIMLVCGIGSLTSDWKPWTLTCEVPGNCEIQRNGYHQAVPERFKSSALKGADVVERRGGSKNRRYYSLRLNLTYGEVWVSSENDRELLADFARQINAGVATRRRFQVEFLDKTTHDSSVALIVAAALVTMWQVWQFLRRQTETITPSWAE